LNILDEEILKDERIIDQINKKKLSLLSKINDVQNEDTKKMLEEKMYHEVDLRLKVYTYRI
jgi:hypothetical protein